MCLCYTVSTLGGNLCKRHCIFFFLSLLPEIGIRSAHKLLLTLVRFLFPNIVLQLLEIQVVREIM